MTAEEGQRMSINVSVDDRNAIKELAKVHGVKMYEMISIMVAASQDEEYQIDQFVQKWIEDQKVDENRKAELLARLDSMSPDQIEKLLQLPK